MKELIVLLSKHIKESTSQGNVWHLVIFVTQLILIGLVLYTHMEDSDDRYHLYMNTTRSMESIHNVSIDPFDGRLQRNLTTEEIMTRKHFQRWHLRQLFK